MLERLNQGYRPTVDELQGYYLSLAVFKNILSSAPYQEILLTPSGHEYYSVSRNLEGVFRLLVYQKVIPRSVMVDYLKILLAFHLALYHLRLFKLLPAIVRKKGAEPICLPGRCPVRPLADLPLGDCPYRVGLFVDVLSKPGTRVSQLAEFSADMHYRRMPSFIRAYFLTKKLDEFGQNLLQLGKLGGGANRQLSLWDVVQLLEDTRAEERKQFFGSWLMSLLEDARGADNALDPEIQKVIDSGLDEMNA